MTRERREQLAKDAQGKILNDYKKALNEVDPCRFLSKVISGLCPIWQEMQPGVIEARFDQEDSSGVAWTEEGNGVASRQYRGEQKKRIAQGNCLELGLNFYLFNVVLRQQIRVSDCRNRRLDRRTEQMENPESGIQTKAGRLPVWLTDIDRKSVV